MAMMTRTSNPTLSDAAMQKAAQSYSTHPDGQGGGFVGPGDDRMTMSGVGVALGVLLAITLAAGAFGWSLVKQTTAINEITGVVTSTTVFPSWLFVPVLAGLGLAFLTFFKPNLAIVTGPLYAATYGVAVGAISAVYNFAYNGLVLQALLCTGSVALVMLVLYGTRVIRVTDRLRRGVIAATMGVMIVYLVTFVASFFMSGTPAIFEAGIIGIGWSLLVVGLASFNLLLDFDFIERGTEAGLPKRMEWYAAFSLLVTLIWLYMEILRLLSKLRN